MAGIGKMVIWAIIVSALVVFLSKAAALFPFYMTMVVETFNLANIAAADNYVKQPYYDASLEGLQERALFNQNPDDVVITVRNSAGREAIGSANEYDHEADAPMNKPYRQRGEPLEITVAAVYPFEFTMWGQPAGFDVPVSFSITTIGLKYYKDLPLDNPYTDFDISDVSYYDYLYDDTD